MLTRFELARILGARALQIAMGAPLLVKVPRTINKEDSFEVAKYELSKKAVPLSVVRFYPNGKQEVIGVK
ncbi:MAG: DNA-directed RNA polymerase subunit K [Candidatus Altiarchaeota archaeon]|nr:DNA-directed RNA polymerase subunit K [Candidatus Altiarchaeota archaeon]